MTKNINGDFYSDLITSVNPNVMNGQPRAGGVDMIIIHHNATTNKDVAMNTWLASGSAGTSAHYELTPSEIIGCVGENYVAYHAGNWDVNTRSVGLEHVNSSGAPNWSVAPETLENSARLIVDICRRYGIPIDRAHIKGHNEISATACPGGINVDVLVKRAQEIANGTQPTPTPAPTPVQKLGRKTNMILFQESGKIYLWAGNKYTYIGTPAELESIKTLMVKAGYDTWIHTDAKQIKYIKKLATLA
ncbi:MAG: N-acetylmuramoyl-L-alanine amidase [Streptococcaceae bacterium]|jgi:N-acetylmuramoyl-L-alanine amidase CwlA|nr:N-acetylmuramoyl-L-alanine amidase [Streptococcaceae bacterium]